MKPVALVIGGAESVWNELALAVALCEQAALEYKTFVTNDCIVLSKQCDYAVTLHTAKLGMWLQDRRVRGHPPPDEIWTHRQYAKSDHWTPDWGGSCGLFATKIALVELGYRRIILCGVPMESESGHVLRRKPWRAAPGFHRGWNAHRREIAPFVRSWSGWTAKFLGRPTAEWLIAEEAMHQKEGALCPM